MQVTKFSSQPGRGRGHDQSTIGLVVCAIGSFRIGERPASRASKVVCKRRAGVAEGREPGRTALDRATFVSGDMDMSEGGFITREVSHFQKSSQFHGAGRFTDYARRSPGRRPPVGLPLGAPPTATMALLPPTATMALLP